MLVFILTLICRVDLKQKKKKKPEKNTVNTKDASFL